MSSKDDFRQLMSNREELYRFFARLFEKEIDEEFFEQLKHVKFPMDREETRLTEFSDALRRLNDYFEYDAGESLDDLAADYAKTFLGAGIAQGAAAFPYESVYTSPKHIMMQNAWSEVIEIYENKGVEYDEESTDLKADHIAIELEYMAFLCDDTSHNTETLFGLEEQKEFLNRHLLNWVPEFCLDIKYFADTEFYRMVGQLTTGFLQFDSFVLDSMIAARKARIAVTRSYRVDRGRLEEILDSLRKDYHIYGPKRFRDRGMRETDGLIRFAPLNSLDEIVNSEQSDFSPKEVFYPISQCIFRFDNEEIIETVNNDPKGIIIFARPCDIEAVRRLDNIFLANGGSSDVYYKTARDKVKFFMIECAESFENCTCVSTGTNRTENYSLALRLGDQSGYTDEHRKERELEGVNDKRDNGRRRHTIDIQIKDAEFLDLFEAEEEINYHPRFIENNTKVLNIPKIDDPSLLPAIYQLEFWKEYIDKCISCGGCNTVCSTCSCYETVDFSEQEDFRKGERRRIWSSCMRPEFSKTAGGNVIRKQADTMMRFKVLHKIYDYKDRFGGDDHMCVGCGRCTKRCPEDISYIDTVNQLYDEVERIKEQRANEKE